MINRHVPTLLSIVIALLIIASCSEVQLTIAPPPSFVLAVSPLTPAKQIPSIQSGVWARQGETLLLFGGRIEGFHGLSAADTTFKTSKANQSIWIVNLSDYSYMEMPVASFDSTLLQFSSSNMEFVQDNDTLFVMGGYGRSTVTDVQSNRTFPQLMAISVSRMISEVKRGSAGNPKNAILYVVKSPYLQITGGEMVRENGMFYVMFGQNYAGTYVSGLNGVYTSAVRQFTVKGNAVVDTVTTIESFLHRRDLNVEKVEQTVGSFYVGYGGVFTSSDDGFTRPVRISIVNGKAVATMNDTLNQTTSQYNCAMVSVFDKTSNTNVHGLLGGIGQYQYIPSKGRWENGDNGAKLPFVQTITQMIWQNGVLTQKIQLPPTEPQMPALLGANAVFIANSNVILNGNVVDYSKVTSDTMAIGIMLGGIKSLKPTSSSIYPTSINNSIYQVTLIKQK